MGGGGSGWAGAGESGRGWAGGDGKATAQVATPKGEGEPRRETKSCFKSLSTKTWTPQNSAGANKVSVAPKTCIFLLTDTKWTRPYGCALVRDGANEQLIWTNRELKHGANMATKMFVVVVGVVYIWRLAIRLSSVSSHSSFGKVFTFL